MTVKISVLSVILKTNVYPAFQDSGVQIVTTLAMGKTVRHVTLTPEFVQIVPLAIGVNIVTVHVMNRIVSHAHLRVASAKVVYPDFGA